MSSDDEDGETEGDLVDIKGMREEERREGEAR